ncbi:13540_t:CDS:2, partial [Funneliformis geosporum]
NPVQQQSSTQMMQTTRSGRPFVKDIHDLFSTLIISLPMETHRTLFKNYANSFTTEETIANLGSLKFTQSSRSQDPNNPTRIITTTTTTTFSMVKDMAKSICQTFLDARLFENLSDTYSRTFRDKSIYGLTPKGIYILERFVSRNGITAPHLTKIFFVQPTQIRLFALERDPETDSINLSKQHVESIFRRFAGPRPNFINKYGDSSEDSTMLSVDWNLGIGLKVRYINNISYYYTFSGAISCDWLCDFTTLISKEEAMKVATEFIRLGLLEPINSKVNDAKKKSNKRDRSLFKYSKSTYYNITEEGRQLALWEYEHLPAKKDSGINLSPQLNDDNKSQRSSFIENHGNKKLG